MTHVVIELNETLPNDIGNAVCGANCSEGSDLSLSAL